jgi:DNA-binding transcriptional MocR family regulator
MRESTIIISDLSKTFSINGRKIDCRMADARWAHTIGCFQVHLLRKNGVAAVPGEAFHTSGGSSLARFCFAKNDRELDEACKRLRRLAVR